MMLRIAISTLETNQYPTPCNGDATFITEGLLELRKWFKNGQ